MEGTNYSLADIASVAKDGEGMGGAWVLIILFALIFGIGGFGGNGRNNISDYATAASQSEILFGQQFQTLNQAINKVGDGISSLGYSQLQQMDANTASINGNVVNEGRSLQQQLSSCCCENQRNVDSLRFDMANYNASTNAAIHAEGEATRAMLQQNKIEALEAKVSELQLANQLGNVVRYPVSSTWAMNGNPFCGCNCSNI